MRRALSFAPQHRQEHRRQHRDDGDHHQEFDEREAFSRELDAGQFGWSPNSAENVESAA
jgi:hypothetical protein